MSRFSNLEFNSEPEGEFQRQAGSVVKDEAYFMNEANTSFEDGDFERALRSFARVLEHNPKNPAAWIGQVRMLIELGEFREAKLWADKALERFPREPELLASKAVALARTGDLDAALAFSDASFEERGDTPYTWMARGDVLLARSEPSADFCFEKAITHSPASWFVRWLVSRIYLHYQRFALALKRVQEAMAIDAAQSVVWLQLGLCQSQLGLVEAGSASIEQALQLNPRSMAARGAVETVAKTDWVGQLRGLIRRLFSR